MSQKAWLLQVPADSPMPMVQFLDWAEQAAKSEGGYFLGVNYVFWSDNPPPELSQQMKKSFTIAFTTEGVGVINSFPQDLSFHLKRLDNCMNPFWHDEKVFDEWLSKNGKSFQDPNEILSFIKILEQAKKNGSA